MLLLALRKMQNNIVTLPRFLYLNLYAILLLVSGVVVLVLPVWKFSLWLLFPQIIVALFFLHGSYHIFCSWEDKKRKYAILIERNKKRLREDTFYEYMQAPCGRLLVKLVLADLGMQDSYSHLRKLQVPMTDKLKASCTPTQANIYINPNYINYGSKKS